MICVKKSNVLKMCIAAVFAALICVSVYAMPIPLPGNGYFNLGDCFIIAASLLVGPFFGGIAGAVGAGLSDLLLGYTYYAPATFVIKQLMAVAAYYVFKGIMKTGFKFRTVGIIAAAFTAELLMVLGYFLFEIPLYGLETAAVDVIGNAVQGVCGMIAGSLVSTVLIETGIFKKIF